MWPFSAVGIKTTRPQGHDSTEYFEKVTTTRALLYYNTEKEVQMKKTEDTLSPLSVFSTNWLISFCVKVESGAKVPCQPLWRSESKARLKMTEETCLGMAHSFIIPQKFTWQGLMQKAQIEPLQYDVLRWQSFCWVLFPDAQFTSFNSHGSAQLE